jgi:endogenous inhibitor of DNA gyrase (YacG/DUF329 family)
MIQLQCPRCGEAVSFTATDQIAECPGCQYAVQVQHGAFRRSTPKAPDKDRDITNAMLICLAIVVGSFGIPIIAGLFGKGAAKFCSIESTPSASVYEEGDLLGQTPLRLPRSVIERTVDLKVEGFLDSQLRIPATDDTQTECKLTASLQNN